MSSTSHPVLARIEAVGTRSALVARCPDQGPERPVPPAAPKSPPISLALSGGGWRAALTAAGVLRFLADAGLLAQLRYVSSVSGGSITHALLACSYERLEESGFSGGTLDEQVVAPLFAAVSTRSLKWALVGRAWKALVPKTTRTDVLANTLDKWFFAGRRLEELSTGCRFVFNAANVTTGVGFNFSRDTYGDYVTGHASTESSQLRVADAVAASAAVPGPFSPLVLPARRFPCGSVGKPKLLDGGVYDNLGLEPLEPRNLGMPPGQDAFQLVLSVGGIFRTGRYGWVPLVRELKRSEGLLYRQATALRT
jgi:NTE family protein